MDIENTGKLGYHLVKDENQDLRYKPYLGNFERPPFRGRGRGNQNFVFPTSSFLGMQSVQTREQPFNLRGRGRGMIVMRGQENMRGFKAPASQNRALYQNLA